MKKIYQRTAISAVLLLPMLVTATSAVSAANVTGPEIVWKVSIWGNPRAFTSGMEALAEKVARETDGKFQIKVFFGSQLSKSRENLDGLKQNAFEGAGVCALYHPDKNPAWMVLSLPFLPLGEPDTGRYVRTKMFSNPAIVAELAKWNALPYAPMLAPPYEFMGRGSVPTTLDGWKGKRVRAGGGVGAAMEILGAEKVDMTANEAATAFEHGELDAAAFPHTYAHVAYKTADQAEWFTSNMAPGVSGCGWLFNQKAYDALPKQYKKLLRDSREMVMDVTQTAYIVQDAMNIPLFEKSLTEIAQY